MKTLLAGLLAAVLAGAAASQAAAEPGGAVREVSMPGKAYAPAELDVIVGDTVVWRNTDAGSHTVTARDDSFDSGYIPAGGTFSRTFTRPSTIPYSCTIHKFMRGTIRVVPVALSGPAGGVIEGGVAALTGLAPAGTAAVAIEHLVGRRWILLRRVEPGPDGSFTTRFRVVRPDRFRARVAGASSVVVRVAVAPRVTARIAGAKALATVRPARPGSRAVLQRYDRELFAWRRVARGRVDPASRVELPLPDARPAHYRIVVRGRDGWADGASRAVAVR